MLGSTLSPSDLSDTFKLSEEAKERDCKRIFYNYPSILLTTGGNVT